MNNATRNELGLPSIEQSMSQRNRRRTDRDRTKQMLKMFVLLAIVELVIIGCLVTYNTINK